ncbi:MAG: restriction endonuclease subunit S [Saprospiraceae bacterium]|nr:restriction endonuclease subunit S [Saprospiraceae bacterium]
MEFEKRLWSNLTNVESVSTAIQYGYTGQKSDSGHYAYVRITDIQGGKIDWSQVPLSDISKSEAPKYLLNKGDILFARTGATAGKSYLFEDDVEAVFASYLIRIVPEKSKILPRFLYWYFQSKEYWQQVDDKVIGAAQPNVNGQKLASIKFPLPPPPRTDPHRCQVGCPF